MLDAIKLCYQNLEAKVIFPDRDNDIFKINAKAMQGHTLAPLAICNSINGFERADSQQKEK